jgi:large subunit ribosomal protein L32e
LSSKRKPKFVRPESWRYVRLKPNWRKPKGIDHKVRLSMKGSPPLVKIGYGSPSARRGLHPSGFREVLVQTPSELDLLDPKKQAVRIGGTVGGRKREQIVEKARSQGLKVLNPVRLKKK